MGRGEGVGILDRRTRRLATVKVRNIVGIFDALRDLGARPQEALLKSGIDPVLFADPESEVPYVAFGRLMGVSVEATGCEAFGLEAGRRMSVTATGLPGLVSLHSPTVLDALEVLRSGLKTTDTGGVLVFGARRGVASFGYVVTAPDIENADQIVDGAMAICMNALRELCGPSWTPKRVRLTRSAPRQSAPFQRFYKTPIDYGAPAAAILFDEATLQWSVAGRNPDYAAILAPLYLDALANAQADFEFAVRAAIRSQLAARRLSREAVCYALGVSERTLTHRLRADGLTYSGLADQEKFGAARDLLMKGFAIIEVAAILGFADQSAFTRAFKAWSGATPARWRTERVVSERQPRLLETPAFSPTGDVRGRDLRRRLY